MINKRNFFIENNFKCLIFAIILLLICSLPGCTNNRIAPISKTGFVLNTVVTITVYDESEEELVAECFEKCKNYELIFSRTDPSSELYKLNQTGSMQVSDELLHVIQTGLYFCELSSGSFDITTGRLSDMYQFASEFPQVPIESEIDRELEHIMYKNVYIDENTVTLKDRDAEIDLGAVAKGYIADRLKDYLISNGVEHALINLGGNVLCIGDRPDGKPFTISVQYPFKEYTNTIADLSLTDLSAVTSGIYERCFEQDGKLYHHILNPKTGYPYDNGLLAVSIIGPESETCDALSTVAFTLGLNDGLKLINSMDGYYAVFITDDYEMHYSEGFEAFVAE